MKTIGLFKTGKASVISGFEGMLDKTYTSAQENLNKGVKEIIAKLNENIVLVNNQIDIANEHSRAIITLYETQIAICKKLGIEPPVPRTNMTLEED